MGVVIAEGRSAREILRNSDRTRLLSADPVRPPTRADELVGAKNIIVVDETIRTVFSIRADIRDPPRGVAEGF